MRMGHGVRTGLLPIPATEKKVSFFFLDLDAL